jgi:hypothetical protein
MKTIFLSELQLGFLPQSGVRHITIKKATRRGKSNCAYNFAN